MNGALEPQVLAIGQEIFTKMKGKKPSVFNKDWWSGKVMDWSMKDEAFKIEMFRFVDVFPTLRNHVEVAEHLQEYFCRPGQDFPASFQWGLAKVKPDSMVAKMAAGQIEKQMTGMAQKFIAGTDAKEALKGLKKLWKQDLAFTLDLLGEATVSEAEAAEYLERYNEILDTLCREAGSWKAKPQLEDASWGTIPRVNVSVKVSSLFSQIDPVDFEGSINATKERLRPLFRKAKENGAFINLDMEQHKYKDLTIAILMSLLDEPEFAQFEHAGIAIQAYLRDTLQDLEKLAAWSKRRGTPITVRLIKGAYWDYETIHSEQEGWTNPVWSKKWETDVNFERCTEFILENADDIRLAIGSHNVRSIAHAIAYATEKGLPKNYLEFQMLYGMAEPSKLALSEMGYRVREYVPIGEMIPGMAYLVRRLLENTSNESWLKQSYADGQSVEQLLAAPGPREGQTVSAGNEHLGNLVGEFRNWPMLDFSEAETREAFVKEGLDVVASKVGSVHEIIIDGQKIETGTLCHSIDPSDGTTLGAVHMANIQLADQAIAAARDTFKTWRTTTVATRAKLLRTLAGQMAERRYELAALMVREVGKTWHEADADLCEAIDFCNYYAQEAEALFEPTRLGRIAGELNQLFHQPRGVAVVIAPWNFPLAILTGMTVAAAVTGNTVIMKPAEQSSLIAVALMDLIEASGFPSGVISFLPGEGESVGRHLVESADVDLIAFTGSMQVGLEILRVAGNTLPNQRQVKKVICEMGGKNAIIVDGDADLDEAVQGVVHSAFGFQGQKCSACSRVIVLESAYPEFTKRLVEATRSLTIGAAADPANLIGPVVDREAQQKIQSYIELGKQEGTLLIERDVPTTGTFVGPTIFEDISPNARLAQEEIFGPVLAVIKVKNFDEALQVANATPFALTGGVFSRSPLNIERAYNEFNVGNLYINRGCTGALVYRQPFGGFKMSGAGTKAGGPDYLLNFVEPRSVTENTMRRGFAPET